MENNSRERKSSLRLRSFDYTTDGAYFVTICTKNRENFFGEIENEKIVLNDCGKIVQKCWNDLPNHYSNCRLDEFVIMPNHAHGIIWINNLPKPVGTGFKPVPTHPEPAPTRPESVPTNPEPVPTHATLHGLSEIIRGFKTFSSRQINIKFVEQSTPLVFRWQRSFHDHIIRNEDELNRIRDYIRLNPINWTKDKNFRNNNDK